MITDHALVPQHEHGLSLRLQELTHRAAATVRQPFLFPVTLGAHPGAVAPLPMAVARAQLGDELRVQIGGELVETLQGRHGRLFPGVRLLQPDEVEFAPQRRWRSPSTHVEYPVAMTVRAGELTCALEPLIDDQELDTRGGTGVLYWEGAVRASVAGRRVGRGYLELTGYGKPLKL